MSLARLALRIEAELGITVSVGLSHAKFLAKIASDLDKPRGFSIIGRAETVTFLADKPVRILPGVGAAAARRLEQAGIGRVGDIARHDPAALVALAGGDGLRLHKLAQGIDPRAVNPEQETKSVSAETTLDVDLAQFDALEPILWRMCEKTALRLKKKGFSGRTATLKLKTADFRILTRSRQLPEPTQIASRFFRAVARTASGGLRWHALPADWRWPQRSCLPRGGRPWGPCRCRYCTAQGARGGNGHTPGEVRAGERGARCRSRARSEA